MRPNQVAKRLSRYVVNGSRFHKKFRDVMCTTQYTCVLLTALTISFASSKKSEFFGW